VHLSLPEGAFRKPLLIEKHHQRKFLGGVPVFSAMNAEKKIRGVLECP